MNVVPIAFAFDNNIITAACVCLSSLLANADKDTFYEIFILHSERVDLRKDELGKVDQAYPNCRLRYVAVDDSFDSAYEVRHVTKATYYRLLLPVLITEYDKIIYSDVDIIFRMDLWKAYSTELEGYYLAATYDIGLNQDEKYLSRLGLAKWQYFQAGFVVLNLKQLREDHMADKFKELAKNKYRYQDQDIINISCKGRIRQLPPCYNVNDCALIYMYWHPGRLPETISEKDCKEATTNGNIHYSGYKPWRRYSIGFDIWWEHYRKSPVYDEQAYFKFFFDKTMLLDSLTLWKRIKILLRYFVYGRYKG